MASKKIKPVNKITLRAFIAKEYGTIRDFANENGFLPNTIRKFLAGDDSLTNVNRKIVKLLLQHNIHPYKEALPKIDSADSARMIRMLFWKMEPQIKERAQRIVPQHEYTKPTRKEDTQASMNLYGGIYTKPKGDLK